MREQSFICICIHFPGLTSPPQLYLRSSINYILIGALVTGAKKVGDRWFSGPILPMCWNRNGQGKEKRMRIGLLSPIQ